MAKPMLVTLPFVMLLLDYWPLGRLSFDQPHSDSNSQSYKQTHSSLRLVWEKVPFFAVAAVSSIVTLIAKQHTPALRSLEALPLDIRIANALVSYASYIGKMIWPQHLSVLYPYPTSLSMWQVAATGLCLAAVSLLALRFVYRHPYFAVGWLWYLGTLVPVIGLVQTGPYAMADRFTYVPAIGLFIAIVWGLPAMLAQWRHQRIALAICSGIVIAVFMVCSSLQVRHWQNSTKLFAHAIDVTAGNFIAHINLGAALADQGRLNEAIAHYSEAIRIKPDYFVAHVNVGAALAKQGNLNEAIAHYSEAIRIEPNFAEAYYNTGNALLRQGKSKEAIAYYSEAIRINPEFSEARQNMALAFERIRTPDQTPNTADALDHRTAEEKDKIPE
jgi:tetratricopeptide (TPR) repeat protein